MTVAADLQRTTTTIDGPPRRRSWRRRAKEGCSFNVRIGIPGRWRAAWLLRGERTPILTRPPRATGYGSSWSTEPNAAVVRRIFAEYLDGKGDQAIAAGQHGLAAHRITPCPPCFTPSAPVPDDHTVCPPPMSRRKRAASETGDAGSCIPVNNAIEADHGRLKSRLRPMRGLKQLRCTRVISARHAFMQNLHRGSLRHRRPHQAGPSASGGVRRLALAI